MIMNAKMVSGGSTLRGGSRCSGAGTPVAALGTFFPVSHSYGYAEREENAPRTATDAPSSETLMNSPG